MAAGYKPTSISIDEYRLKMVAWAFKKNQDQKEKSFVGVMLQSHSEKVRKKVLF